MLDTILITVLIVAICIALLSIGIFLKGKFPNTHVSGNKALRKKGIEETGFTKDDNLKIEYQKNKIIITKEEN